MLPSKIWHIGELISFDSGSIDASDICLVELFYPFKHHFPDHYIEIHSQSSVLSKEQFYDGQFLLVSGYPFESNAFDFTPVSEHFTHSTTLHRKTIPGAYISNEDIGHITFELTDGDIQHKNVNGMSGGAIYNVQPKANQVKLAGIPISAGNNICRFIPSYIFIKAILSYRKSSCRIVDPIAENPPPLEDQLRAYANYLIDFDPKFSSEKI